MYRDLMRRVRIEANRIIGALQAAKNPHLRNQVPHRVIRPFSGMGVALTLIIVRENLCYRKLRVPMHSRPYLSTTRQIVAQAFGLK
jgi:hypothetical protein